MQADLDWDLLKNQCQTIISVALASVCNPISPTVAREPLCRDQIIDADG